MRSALLGINLKEIAPLHIEDILENNMMIRFLFLLFTFNLSGCVSQDDITYVYLSSDLNKLETKVNGGSIKDFDSLGEKLSSVFKAKKRDTILYIVFRDDVGLSDAENIVGLAQAIGYSDVRLYALNMKTEKMQKINLALPEPLSDNLLRFIGAKSP
jgi:hypothetical protein